MNIRNFSKPIKYIFDTDIGNDIDDVFALLMVLNQGKPPIGVTTTHINPIQKAHIAKTILSEYDYHNIPVFAGKGCDRDEPRIKFKKQNPCWFSKFGFPQVEPGAQDEKLWYPKQGDAYKAFYPDKFGKLEIYGKDEKGKGDNGLAAAKFIIDTAKQHSPKDKLTIAAIGPLHNIYKALRLAPEIAQNIRIFSMGGGHPFGYNWLIAPHKTAYVLKHAETICISSQFIRENNFAITEDEFKKMSAVENKSLLAQTIFADWKNWNNDKINLSQKLISDPVTVFAATEPDLDLECEEMAIDFPCLDENGKMRPEFQGVAYNNKDNNILINITPSTNESKTKVKFVTGFNKENQLVRDEIVALIQQTFAPVKDQKHESQIRAKV